MIAVVTKAKAVKARLFLSISIFKCTKLIFYKNPLYKNHKAKKRLEFPKNHAEARLQSFRVSIFSPYNSIDLYLHLITALQKYEIFPINIFGTNFD